MHLTTVAKWITASSRGDRGAGITHVCETLDKTSQRLQPAVQERCAGAAAGMSQDLVQLQRHIWAPSWTPTVADSRPVLVVEGSQEQPFIVRTPLGPTQLDCLQVCEPAPVAGRWSRCLSFLRTASACTSSSSSNTLASICSEHAAQRTRMLHNDSF